MFQLKIMEKDAAEAFSPAPGQFVELTVPGVGEAPILIPSPPTRPGIIELCVRKAGLVTSALFEMEKGDEERVEAIKRKAVQSQKNRPGTKQAMETLKQGRPDGSFWERLAEKCINCGSCVYVCPTCTCSNVFDLPSEGGHEIQDLGCLSSRRV